MSKKTKSTKTTSSKSATKTQSAPDAAANDQARAEALAKLNAKTAATKPSGQFTTTKRERTPNADRDAKPARDAKAATRSKADERAESKRLSALDAAAQVLASLHAKEARAGLSAPELIERMAALKLWTSPGGKTPAATLYAAITREIAAKGTASRFARIEPGTDGSRGRFTAHSSSTRRATVGKVKP
jgi:hypothetical protein